MNGWRRWAWCLAWVALTGCAAITPDGPASGRVAANLAQPEPVRNVIFMMADGVPHEAWALARWVKGAPLVSDQILTGAVQTYGADSIITDSAPGATAFATGHKASDKTLAVAPWRVTIAGVSPSPYPAYAPLPTVLEAARHSGRATGLVTTANLQHASPAAFSAHTHDRNLYLDIAMQQAHQGIDVMLGGGGQYLRLKQQGGQRDDIDLLEAWQSQGHPIALNRASMLASQQGRLLGVFAADDMAYELDRAQFAPEQPSLAEMTHKAIELLSQSDKGRERGFFLFVEAAKVDWAAHANDPSGIVSDLLAYDAAIQVALSYAQTNGHTLLISTSDHGNGGLSIGRRELENYAFTDDDSVVSPLRRSRMTGEGIARLLATDKSADTIKRMLNQHWGISDLSEAELHHIQTYPSDGWLQYALGPVLSKRAGIGWTSNGHTGGDTMLYSFGPQRPTGLWDNARLGRHMGAVLGVDLPKLGEALFVDVAEALAGTTMRVEGIAPNVSVPHVLVHNSRGQLARIGVNRNTVSIDGKDHAVEGVAVLSLPAGKLYAPRQMVDLILQKMGD